MNIWAKRAAGIGAGVLATAAAAVVVERRVVKTRRAGADDAASYGALRSPAIEVDTEDGTTLHAEVDEVAPYAHGAKPSPGQPTVVFVHGYALNLDCWHFQREALRGKHRMVFYDQRSHGRSGRSPRKHANIDQLGDDLRTRPRRAGADRRRRPRRPLDGRHERSWRSPSATRRRSPTGWQVWP